MPATVKFDSTEFVQLPSGAPKLIDTAPGPIALASCTAPIRLGSVASGASMSTMRAYGAVAWLHWTSSAISVAQPES